MLVFVGGVDGGAALRVPHGYIYPEAVIQRMNEGAHGRGSDDDARIAMTRPTLRRRCHAAGDSDDNDAASPVAAWSSSSSSCLGREHARKEGAGRG